MIHEFGDHELDTGAYELRRAGAPVPVEPQVFDVLRHLVEHADRVVPKEELLDAVWGSRFVSESALTSRIKAARRAVGDDGTAQAVIRTAHGRGYRFVAPVSVRAAPRDGTASHAHAPAPERRLEQEIRFCRSGDGVRLAYAVSGTGPPLVKAANWLSHLDDDWDSPVWRHWLQALSAHHRLVRYDERGCGLSDRDVDDLTFEAWVHDLETVVDEAGIERCSLLGVSQGGAVAVAYAARHPERVAKLVLYGAYAQGPRRRARTPEELREADLLVELARVGWGRDSPAFRQVFTARFLPGGSRDLWDAFDDLQHRTTSPENAVRFIEAFGAIDVTDLAPRVQAPTLILHARDDQLPPLEQGLRLAALIPESRFVPLDSANHILLEGEPAWTRFIDEVHAFLDAPA